MTKEIKELSKILITEIQKLIDNIDYYEEEENNEIEDFQDDSTYTNKQRLQKQETWYDQMFEKHKKAEKMVENKDFLENLISQFQMKTTNFLTEWRRRPANQRAGCFRSVVPVSVWMKPPSPDGRT